MARNASSSASFRKGGVLHRSGRKSAVRGPGRIQHPWAGPGQSLGVRYGSLVEAADLVMEGLPIGAVATFQRISGLTLARVKDAAGISEGSFSRRKKSGRLSQVESERLLRISRIFEKATALYDGDSDGARQWLETPVPSLGERRPLDLAQTEPGAREVEDLIGRIENGVVS